MSHDTPTTRTLRRAAVIAGGTDELAKRWGIALPTLEEWLTGAIVPPTEIFVNALEIVAHEPIAGT